MIPSFLSKILDASKQSEPPIRLRPKPSWRGRVPAWASSHHLSLLGATGIWHIENDGGGKWQQKSYIQPYSTSTNIMKKVDLFTIIFVQNLKVASATRSAFFHRWVWCFVFTLDVEYVCFIVFTPVLWYRRTLETFWTGLMHYVNKCRKKSVIHKSIRRYSFIWSYNNPPCTTQ